MKKITLTATALLFLACSDKNITVNGLVCPEDFDEARINKDLTECRYYDESDAKRSAKPKLSDDCKECLIKRGYDIEE